jgi:transcriptional regulator with XRE-family HTH domain
MSKLRDWLSTDKRKLEFAEERLIVDVAEKIWDAMQAAGVSKKDIADRLGRSKPFITQLLSGSRNMTLRSLADIAYSLGYRVQCSLKPENSVEAWQPMTVLTFTQPYINAAPVNDVDVNSGDWTALHIRAA